MFRDCLGIINTSKVGYAVENWDGRRGAPVVALKSHMKTAVAKAASLLFSVFLVNFVPDSKDCLSSVCACLFQNPDGSRCRKLHQAAMLQFARRWYVLPSEGPVFLPEFVKRTQF